jgi:glycosyltransferase involved in cell wall biosynthesis
MVMLEAIQFGVPIIATNIGGAKDYIVDQISGLIINKGDKNGFVNKVKLLKENNKLYLDISKKARETYIKNFTPEAVISKFKDIVGV